MTPGPWRRGVLAALLAGLSLVGCYRPAVPSSSGPGDCRLARWRVPAAINVARAERGLAHLQVDDRLIAAAERHSREMADDHRVDHTGPDGSTAAERARAAGYEPAALGEVLAGGYSSGRAVVHDWLRSRAHRRILLLSTVAEVGAACVVGSDGAAYWTAVVGSELQ